MRLLDRYIVRETALPFLLALSVLTFLLGVMPMMQRAQQFLSKGVSVLTVVHLLVLLLPQALGITIPMAFLIALLMAFGRLSADRETVALLACGVSLRRMLRPVLVMAVVATLATLYVMIVLIPNGNQAFLDLSYRLLASKTASDIHPRMFFQDFPNKVLYVQAVDPDGTWRDVLVADTSTPGRPKVSLAATGRFTLDSVKRTVTIDLDNGHTYAPGAETGIYDITEFAETSFSVDAESVFANANPEPDDHSMTIAQLQAKAADLRAHGFSDHNEVISIQQKFSLPVACLVLALLGLTLGVHTRREGKLAGFALGLGVIFVYYALMYLAENLAKGGQFPAVWARWVPDIALGAAGLWLLWWRSQGAERGLTLPLPVALSRWLTARARAGQDAAGAGARGRVRVVIRFPRLWLPRPRLLDLYVAGRYLRAGLLSFAGLLGVFYISAFVDLSEKLFKHQATTGMLLDYFWYETPQYVYWVLPIATLVAVLVTIGALTRTSELTVMRACGVSLYRAIAPLLLLALVWSGLLFVLQEQIMGVTNRRAAALEDTIRGRPPRLLDAANRNWLAGAGNKVYYYQRFDPQRQTIEDLSVFEWSNTPFQLVRHTFAERAGYEQGATWLAHDGWVQTFTASRSRHAAVARRAFPGAAPLTLEPVSAFRSDEPDTDLMTFSELRHEVARLRSSGFAFGDYAVAMHTKIAFPLVTVIMTLIAVPFALTTGRRGALYGVGLGVVLSVAYRAAFVFFGALGGAQLLPPAVAAWAPNGLFAAAAGYLLLSVRT